MYSNLVLSSTKTFQVIISIIKYKCNYYITNIKDATNNHELIITWKPSYSVWVTLWILNNFCVLILYQWTKWTKSCSLKMPFLIEKRLGKLF